MEAAFQREKQKMQAALAWERQRLMGILEARLKRVPDRVLNHSIKYVVYLCTMLEDYIFNDRFGVTSKL